jgi:hypothetical protein
MTSKHKISISGTSFLLNGEAFAFTGLSFFNAIYNGAFNQSSTERGYWLQKFGSYGINVLRIWAQWDNHLGFIDTAPEATLYNADGSLLLHNLERLKTIIHEADELGMVIELVLFANESWVSGVRLDSVAAARAVTALTQELLPFRNVAFQVWNEASFNVLEHVQQIKTVDPQRLVSNSPGGAGILGDDTQNQVLDFLTPHTSRQDKAPQGRHWQVAPQEISGLLHRFNKPVVDDEPARNGTAQSQAFGGPKGATSPTDHILQIYQVWQLGAYIVYHHDMFQAGYGAPSIPPHGIPDPEWSSYHRTVLEFIGQRERYWPSKHEQ